MDDSVVLLDGGLGALLHSNLQNPEFSLLPWSVEHLLVNPREVLDTHIAYIKCGCDVITTNAFRTNRRAIAQTTSKNLQKLLNDYPGIQPSEDLRLSVNLVAQSVSHSSEALTQSALILAQMAVEATAENRGVQVAVNTTTLEDGFEPSLVPDNAVLYKEHSEKFTHMQFGHKHQFDIVLAESINTSREAVNILFVANEKLPDKKIWISLGLDTQEYTSASNPVRLFRETQDDDSSGELLTSAIEALLNAHDAGNEIDALLFNCCAPSAITGAFEEIEKRQLDQELRERNILFGGYANIEEAVQTNTSVNYRPDSKLMGSGYAKHALDWADRGARIIGGCCGVTPVEMTHIHYLLKSQGYRS